LFHQAQQIYGDVNPLPLAWVYAQQGIALLRFGHCDAAVRFFEAARERLPQYYLANEHLAECEARLGHLDRARALYGEVVAATGNPEFIGALARVERQAGRVDVADRLTTQAQDGYARLLREQPRAYAQHAAEFYLDAGLAAAALPLARDNLRWRHDVMSYVLLARAALAAGAGAEACTALAGALATPLRPPELSALESSQGDCDRRAAR
jgi:tetratricopeptide (TPR) repeat protein